MSHMKTGNRLDLVNGATFASLCPILQYWSGLPLPSQGDIPTHGSTLGLTNYR